MITTMQRWPLACLAAAMALAALTVASVGARAQGVAAQPAAPVPPPQVAAPQPAVAPRMERLAGVWVEGPGFEVTYGSAYDGCAQRCLANAKCVMIEYYRPEKKCNLYNALRPHLKGGSSDVALRR